MSSIRRRLTIGLGMVCGVLWAVGGLGLYLALRAGLVAEFDEALKATAAALATFTEHSEGQMKFESADELRPAFERADRPDYFELYLPSGSTLARSPSLPDADLPRRAGTLEAPEFWDLTLPDGQHGRATGIRFAPKEDEDAPGSPLPRGPGDEVTLVVARHRTDLDRRLHQLVTALFLVGAASAAATALVGTIVVRRGLQPLSRLAERAASIDASSLELRFPTDKMPAELSPIGLRLNDLLARLEASFARERRFSADVAHELRTPIAELRALAEVTLKWPEADAARNALQDALAIALQMEAIATNLLSLTRCEGGLLTVHPEPVRLAALIDELWHPLADQAGEKRLSVTLSVHNGVSWLTDPALLRAILGNLLSNAVEHSPLDGAILVRAEETGGGRRLLVSNTTNDLTPDDLPHLFERFWRKDLSRSSSDHCGLGLALTKAYAESLGLHLRADLTRPSELTIELSGAPRPPRP